MYQSPFFWTCPLQALRPLQRHLPHQFSVVRAFFRSLVALEDLVRIGRLRISSSRRKLHGDRYRTGGRKTSGSSS